MPIQGTLAVIPARYGSTRFPGKPLVPIAGKPMIRHVYERAAAATRIGAVLVATDDRRIAAAVAAFGGDAVLTASTHPTGTDRIAEAVANTDADLVVNVQCDEPLIPSRVLDRLVAAMQDSEADMGTVAVPLGLSSVDVEDPNRVKVVVDRAGYALYFSRAPIPWLRPGGEPVAPLLHWGLYAYRRAFLERFVRWPRGELENCEMLEQLRALENGARILVVQADEPTIGVDVPADVARVESLIREQGEVAL